MTPAELDRLTNILARTASNHNGQALVAARKANEILRRHRLSWQEFIAGIPRHEGERERDPEPERHGDMVGDAPAAWRRPVPQRKIVAAQLRLRVANVPVVLYPLTLIGLACAWALEGDDTVEFMIHSVLVALVFTAIIAMAASPLCAAITPPGVAMPDTGDAEHPTAEACNETPQIGAPFEGKTGNVC